MTAVELLPPGEATPENSRWHELRRAGITASEIAIVLGISPWESPFSLYWRKVNGWRTDDNQFISVGRHLEDAIAQWWAAERDVVLMPAGLYASPERPWQIATPDRLVHDACPTCAVRPPETYGCSDCMNTGLGSPTWTLLECKWVAYSWDGWGEQGTDQIPTHYRAQCLWQADVMGVDEVHVAALGPGGFRAYVVRRDEDDLAVMRKAGEEFHRRLTEQNPPPLDSHQATIGALKRLHPSVGEGDVEIPPSVADFYQDARRDKKEAEERIAEYEAKIRAALGSTYARAVCAGGLVASRSVFEQQRIDVARLRKEQPDIAAEYTTTTTVDRLSPGRISHE